MIHPCAEGDSGVVLDEEPPPLFLIAHKVRGKPAFDIAHRLEIAEEDGWIIPTSGHRAYPYWWDKIPIETMVAGGGLLLGEMGSCCIPPMPLEHPDHYACNDTPATRPTGNRIDLQALGLVRAKAKIDRRI